MNALARTLAFGMQHGFLKRGHIDMLAQVSQWRVAWHRPLMQHFGVTTKRLERHQGVIGLQGFGCQAGLLYRMAQLEQGVVQHEADQFWIAAQALFCEDILASR
ncbi:hypothetical protein D3C86_1399370 [compost metagenome]